MTKAEEIAELKAKIPTDSSWQYEELQHMTIGELHAYIIRVQFGLLKIERGAALDVMNEKTVAKENRILFIRCAHYLICDVLPHHSVQLHYEITDNNFLIKRLKHC